MSIAGYSSSHDICVLYDELRLQTAVGYAQNFLNDSNAKDMKEASVCRALYKEKFFTSYTNDSKSSAIDRMRYSARLFGDFLNDSEGARHDLYFSSRLTRKEKEFVSSVLAVFQTRGKTDWSFNGVKHGTLRLYPSNGAIHALRPRLILQNCIVDYFPFRDEIDFVNKVGLDLKYLRLEVIIEFSRIFEKYRDVGALAAIYIEFGHLLAVINEFVKKPIVSVGFADSSKFFVDFLG